MAVPGIPTNLVIQQGNGQIYLSWDLTAGATSYKVNRSTDGVNFSLLASPVTNSYLDTAVTVGTQYFYTVQSHDASGDSSATLPVSEVPTLSGLMTLGQIRLLAQQEADRVGSLFVGTAEWNSYINKSADELYDIIMNTYEGYFIGAPVQFTTDGVSQQYNLTTIAPNFYKLNGVDCGLDNSGNARVTLKKFDFISRNRYVYPNVTSTFLGVFNLRYRVVGSTLMFIPTPAAGQIITLWYTPRRVQLLQDTDMLDGFGGWDEYVVIDAAIKAMAKEESDTSELKARKMDILKRIEESANNRDAGQPDTISDTRSWSERTGVYGPPNSDGSFGGF